MFVCFFNFYFSKVAQLGQAEPERKSSCIILLKIGFYMSFSSGISNFSKENTILPPKWASIFCEVKLNIQK